MLRSIRETLYVHLQVEAKEGLVIRESQKSGPSVARQSRKQYKDTAELVMAITEKLEEKGGVKK